MKPMNFFRLADFPVVTVSLVSLVLSCTVHAQTPANNNKVMSGPARHSEQDRGQAERPHREPPPQAYEKCKAKKEGDVVQIITPHGEKVTAHCTTSEKGLFARPERPPHPPEGSEDATKQGGQRKK